MNFELMKMIEIHLSYPIMSEIIVITQKNLEELLIEFAILDTKHPEKF